ncbi:MAG: glycosyltransferase family 4 protein [Hyphomonadaceae bacterium]|nr:glycosyltransferase family 4 protein [Hyphomonadaceae bacterium]
MTAAPARETAAPPELRPAAVPVIEVLAGWPDRGGGIGQFLHYLLDANREAGALDVRAVLDPRGRGSPIASLWRTPLALVALARLRAGRSGAAVVHVHLAGRLSTVRKLAVLAFGKLIGFRCVLHYHEFGYAAYLRSLPGAARALAIAILRLADHHIVLGAGELERLPPLLGLPTDRFTAICNGVPRAALGRPREPAPGRIVFVGMLSERKGVSDLIEAAATLPAHAEIVFCGGGDVERYRALAAKLGVAARCRFLGHCTPERVQAELQCASIFTLPSYAEGLSVALLEAMARGCPVVATRVGEHAEVLRPGENALVAAPGDVAGLAQALGRLLADPDLAERLGAAGRATVAARFTDDRALHAIAAVLAGVEAGR